uniref:protein-serine/threonine phosphatase n=1 Tax=Equus asinus TaxID=9793 RepID=A0A9L0IEH2_EQUAS
MAVSQGQEGSLDNMTCILVCFPGAPRPHEEAIRKEQELDAVLGRRVAELCSSAQEPPSLNTVFRTLASEDIHDLPPGGGVYCKAAVIADAYSQLCQASGERRELCRLAEGRQADGGTPQSLFPHLLLPSHRKSYERGNSTHHLDLKIKSQTQCF